MHESERNRLVNEIRRLRLAEADMAQAAMAALALRDEHHNGDLCRALETAIAVCYARPFGGSNRVGVLGDQWAPQDAPRRALHDQLLELRNQVYAHTDRSGARDVVDAGDLLGAEHAGTYLEQWHPIDRAALTALLELMAHQQERFRSRVEQCQRELAAASS